MVTSYFRPEVEIWPYRACATKWPKHVPHFIGVEEHDGNVRF